MFFIISCCGVMARSSVFQPRVSGVRVSGALCDAENPLSSLLGFHMARVHPVSKDTHRCMDVR